MRDPSPTSSAPPLDERAAALLHGVMEAYLASGLPVGSRALAEMRPDSPSSATIRHVLAELDQNGYLSQPHTSAGRVPTAKAIRWWLQGLGTPLPLCSDDSQRFERELLASSDETTLWLRASEFLADVTQQVGVVAVRPWLDAGLKRLRFFRLTDHRVLAILVAADGQVRERVGRVPEPYSQAELDDAARYFNLNFVGSTLPHIRRELRHRVEEERAAYDELLKRALVLAHCGLLEMQDDGAVYFQGASHLAGQLDGQKLSEMLGRLNQKESWLRLLDHVAASGEADENSVAWAASGPASLLPRPSIRVRVGLDQENMPEFSLISTGFCSGPTQAAIAILGSTRMQYQRALSAVTLVRQLLDRVLGPSPA